MVPLSRLAILMLIEERGSDYPLHNAQCSGPNGKMAITQKTWRLTSSISGLVKILHLNHVLTTL